MSDKLTLHLLSCAGGNRNRLGFWMLRRVNINELVVWKKDPRT